MNAGPLNWAKSKTLGNVTEIAVMAPVKPGRIPGERRTYEERLRTAIESVARRVSRGTPVELDRVQTIHFGRMTILRPEQYLVNSQVPRGVRYHGDAGCADIAGVADFQNVPVPADEYVGRPHRSDPGFRTWLLTQVSFDRDIKVYFRDIAEFITQDFDRIFDNCEDFPSTRDFEAFWTWIRRYQISTDLFYTRYPNLSVARIKQLEDFKRRFDAFVEKVRSPTGRRVESMDELFDEFLRESQQYAADFPALGGTYVSKDQ